MKPDWDKLMKEFADSTTAGVFDVDCTADGKPLCDANGVRGYPSIKYGDPNNLEDYKGGRDYDSLFKFASEELKPVCSPSNIDLCDDEKKLLIARLKELGIDELEKQIKSKEEEQEEVEKVFKDEVSKLQASYQQLMEGKDAKMEEIKASGLGLMKAVKASLGTKGSDEL